MKNSTVLDSNLTTGVPTSACSDKCMQQLSQSYEPKYGGFGSAPKFPQSTIFNFLFHYYSRSPNSEGGKKALEMSTHTLTSMSKGGIHDHVAQGFARYSTDERWHVPHFEKMLYDQGQLAVAYATAFVATGNQIYADTLRDILAYVSRDLSDKSGGFYSAEDADSLPTLSAKRKKEGAFCVWTYDELQHLLGETIEGTEHKQCEVFAYHYGVKPEGNVNPSQDPHRELTGANVLIVSGSEVSTAEKFDLELTRTKDILEACRDKLFRARLLRPRPHLDDKMITAWNGLMISGFAKASQALKDSIYEQRAITAANFIKLNLFDAERGTLLRSCYKGKDGNIAQISVPINGFLDDYAFVIRGLLDLYETCLDADWLEWAEQLQDTQDQLFWDTEDAGYFSSPSDDHTVVMRLKEDQDGAEPSGNSVAVSNLIRLSLYLERSDYQEKATKLLTGFTTRLTKVPVAMPELASALMVYNDSATQVFITGQRTNPDTAALLDVVYSRLVPGRVLALADERVDSVLYRKCKVVTGMKSVKGRAAAYVCRHHTCSLPVNSAQALSALLDQRD